LKRTSSKNPYRRLPGRAQKGFGLLDQTRQQLWMAEDHLLVLDRHAYTERCKRFYLKDIQAIAVCRTNFGKMLNVTLSLLAACFLLAAVGLSFAGENDILDTVFYVFMWIFGIAGGILLAMTGVNTLYGPTCRCYLHTAAQAERLTALGRLRTAQRSVALLKTAIEATQGTLPVEEASESPAPAPESRPVEGPAL
jgi:hypothetical protein